ncbi:MAG: restriction endonuclease, partial [Chloroflexi bacterium]
MVPVTIRTGLKMKLSPGAHSLLQARVIEDFAPRFAPGAEVLYLGDTAKKTLYIDNKQLEKLSVPISKHDKLPDVLLIDERSNRLFVVEAVTSHGPVSSKR